MRHTTSETEHMLRIVIVLLLLLSPVAAQSGPSSYFCKITSTYELTNTGELEPWEMTSHMQEQPFSIDRATGLITSEFHQNHDPKVLWNPRPGDGTTFIVTDSATMGTSARISSLAVKEWVESEEKPFIWYWVTNVLVGTCR